MSQETWDNALIKTNREYLDNYYQNNMGKDKDSIITKSLRVLKGFGIKGFIEKVQKKAKTDTQYMSNYDEELCKPIQWGKKKIAVYTAIIGKYDKLEEPKFVSPYCDYFIFTDADIPTNSVWKKRDLPTTKEYLKLGNYQRAKYFKIFPHKLFPEYDYSIWVDGNITIIGDLAPFVDRMRNKAMAEFKHPNNDCIYDEAYSIVSQGKAQGKAVRKQIEQYKKDGFPAHYGLFENSFIVREHNDERCIRLMNMWWKQMEQFTWRDQLSLSYVLWKSGYGIDFEEILGPCWRWNPRLRQNNHI